MLVLHYSMRAECAIEVERTTGSKVDILPTLEQKACKDKKSGVVVADNNLQDVELVVQIVQPNSDAPNLTPSKFVVCFPPLKTLAM